MDDDMPPYAYEAGENRGKHKWGEDCAGVVCSGTKRVGKCPKNFPLALAVRLLEDGVHEWMEWEARDTPPKRIYNVHGGIPYVARRNAPGSWSYHGYPLSHRRIRREVYERLRDRARRDEREREFDRWCRDHGVSIG